MLIAPKVGAKISLTAIYALFQILPKGFDILFIAALWWTPPPPLSHLLFKLFLFFQ